MQMDSKLFDDLAKLASGAMGTAAGLREELEAQVRQQLERMLARMDVVTREEFDAVREMAETARTEQEALAAKVAELEARLESGDAAAVSPPGGPGTAEAGPGGAA
ncbi:MAG: accessory factor UbiK family protein [Alphaproteobacteria bacterium]|jgi:BMFP domain-containing protein YqiC|nr:accessory factor UbiK family protein [Alphaproteobacteria bacterium]